MSQASDAATGHSIKNGEEIVALVIDRRVGGYPDATSHAAMPGLNPTGIFEPLSLPIRAKYDEFGLIEPYPGQLAVDLILNLTEQPNWKAFQDKAFGVDGGIRVGAPGGSSRNPFNKPGRIQPRVLGLAIYRQETWELAKALSGHKDRQEEIDTVIATMGKIRALISNGDKGHGLANANLLQLRQSAFYPSDEDMVYLPPLAQALQHRSGGDLLGRDAVAGITYGQGLLGSRLLDHPPAKQMPELLGAIWDLQAAERGLTYLAKPYAPSQLTGGGNDLEVFELGISMLEQAGQSALRRDAEFPESERLDKLQEALLRMDEVRAEIAAGIARIRDEEPSAPTP